MYKKYHAYIMKKYKALIDKTIEELYPSETERRALKNTSFSKRVSEEKTRLSRSKKSVSNEYQTISRSRDFMNFLKDLIYRRILIYEMRKEIKKQVRGEEGFQKSLMHCFKTPGDAERAKYVGEGDFGRVYRIGEDICVKIVNISEKEFESMDDIVFQREVDIGKDAGKWGIGPEIYESYVCLNESESACYGVIYMQWLDGLTLYDWLLKSPSASEIEKVRDMVEEKIQKMHDHGMVHMDLHNGNVFIQLSGSGELKKVYFIDFGFARYIQEFVKTRNHERINKYLFFKSREYIYRRLTDLILRKISLKHV